MTTGIEILFACASLVHPETLNAIVKTESNYNPFAIAVVDGEPLEKQPTTRSEAEQAIDKLEAQGLNYSVGLGQVNKGNFAKYNVTGKQLLDTCTNIKISEQILNACYVGSPNKSVAEALSCYYAGNYSYGFVKETVGKKRTAYVERVIENYIPQEKFSVPSIKEEIPSALAKVREPKKKNANSRNTVKQHQVTSSRPILIKNSIKRDQLKLSKGNQNDN